MRTIHPPKVDVSQYTLPVELGGTGANNVTDAARNLKIVQYSQIGQANGPVPLGPDGKIPLIHIPPEYVDSSVNLSGDLTIITGQPIEFTITDYDSFKTYPLTVSQGSISRNDDKITYTPPALPSNVQFNLAGRSFTIDVVNPQPAKPQIFTPLNNAQNIPFNFNITTSAFQAVGGVFTHLNTDWQIASDTNFSNIVFQSLDNATNKTSLSVSNLPPNSPLYIRVRYRGSDNSVSNYSNPVTIVTKSNYDASLEEAIILPDSGQTGFGGANISVSDNGLKVVTQALRSGATSYGQFSAQRVYVFEKITGTWSKTFTLDTDPDYPSGFNTGSWFVPSRKAVISPDGNRLFLLETQNGPGFTNQSGGAVADGRVRIYAFNGTTWVLESTLSARQANQYQGHGSSFTCNQDASVAFVGTYWPGATNSYAAHFCMYTRSGSTWTFRSETNFVRQLAGTDYSLHLSKDGTRLAVAYHVTDTTSNTVAASIYTVGATSITFEADITVPVATFNKSRPGRNIRLNATGNVLAIASGGSASIGGANDANSNSVGSGSIYIFTRTGTAWTFHSRIINNDVTVAEELGLNLFFNDAGNRLVASASSLNNGATLQNGAYYIYDLVSNVWTRRPAIRSSSVSSNERFAANASLNSALNSGIFSGNNKIYSFV